MTFFPEASSAQQSLLMTALLAVLIFDIFSLFTAFRNEIRRLYGLMDSGLFLLLFVTLTVLANSFYQIHEENNRGIVFPLPMWVLWCVTGAAFVCLVIETAVRYRRRNERLDGCCVKQAMDMLPCAVCYFSPSGDVKLCNLQMHRLFHCMAQKELQTMDDLTQALGECSDRSRIVRLSDVRQTYLFPDGKVWRYSQSRIIANGTTYTEALFSDVTELYEKNLELHRQTEQLQKIAGELKQLSENVQTLAEEREMLTAKTRLHDSMGSGLLAIRRILQQKTDSSENNAAVMQFRRAVEALQEENIGQQYDVSEFIRDAAVSGIRVDITGELPKEKGLLRMILPILREACVNAARHADAAALYVKAERTADSVILRITNDGGQPENEVVPSGGLADFGKRIAEAGGSMKIQSRPEFMLTVTLPTKNMTGGIAE